MNNLLQVLLIFCFFTKNVQAAQGLEAKWLGVAGVALTDGKRTLLFDPVFTKPKIFNWLLGTKFKSDPELVKKALNKINYPEIQGIFISHTHFDHVSDASEIAKSTGALVYGGESLKRVVTADTKFNSQQMYLIEDRSVIKIGEFTITAIRREHSAIVQAINLKFFPGEVPADFNFNFYDYREGETWCYLVEHTAGRILIDQGSHFFEGNAVYVGKIDAYFIGVANKVSLENLVHENIEKIGAKKNIPLHFDFFFLQSDFLESLRLPRSDLPKINALMESNKKREQEFIIPELFKPITLTQ